MENKEKKGLTLSIIFEADSANYGEGYGNVSALKRISRADGNSYTYISRQALIFSLKNNLGWLNTETAAQGKVAQYTWDSNIKESPEIDLFGYMKTKSKDKTKSKNKDKKVTEDENKKGEQKIRAAVVRFSNAISLENYSGDMEFGTNLSLANRTPDKKGLLPYNAEIHKSYYAYTVTIDLERVGVGDNENEKKDLSVSEKKTSADRVNSFLNVLKTLYRDIRGRRENLSPIFIIGGVYNIKNPFFENRLKVEKNKLIIETIKDTLKMDEEISKNTICGLVDSIFSNTEEIKKELNSKSVAEVIEELCKKVDKYYA